MRQLYIFTLCTLFCFSAFTQESTYSSFQKIYQSCNSESCLHSKYLDQKSLFKDSSDGFLNLMAYVDETRKYNPKKAFEIIQKSDISLINKSEFEKGVYSLTLGAISIISENPDMSIKHFKSALQNFKQTNTKYYEIYGMMSLGRAFTALNQLDSGRIYLHEALRLSSINFPDLSLKIELNQAVNRKLAKDYVLAENLFLNSLSKNSSSMETYMVCRTQANLAEVYMLTSQLDKADSLYSEALFTANKYNLRSDQYRIHNDLSILNQRRGKFKKGLIYRNKADSIRKQAELISVSDQMGQLEKKLEIDILDQKALLKEKLLDTEKKINTILFTVLIIISVLLFLLVHQLLKLQKKNTILIKNRKSSSRKRRAQVISHSNNKLNPLIAQLESIQSDESIIFDESLTMEKLAKKLNTNRTYLSEAINLGYEMSFSKWINQIRINKACDLLLDSTNDKYSLEAIAGMVGFTSISSFNTNFKKNTGITPSYFRNHRDD